MNPNDFTSVNIDPQKITAKTVTPDDVVNALNAIAAIKKLHTQKDEYCSVCLDPTGWSEEWPCPTAEAWVEK